MAKKKNEPESKDNWLVRWKKPLRALSLVIALGGSFVLMIFTFLIHDALDKTEQSVTKNIEGIQQSLVDVENALTGIESELDAADKTISDLDDSLSPLADGLESTADALSGISSSLGLLSISGLSLGIDTGDLDSAADSLKESSTELGSTDFEEHADNILDLKGSISEMKTNIAGQRAELGQTKKTVQEVMGLMKIANVLFFLVVISMFFMLSLNSIAGLL